MRRFRFEIVSPEHFPDPEGALLRNLDEARREAVRLGAALVRDYPEAFDKPGPWRMVILDEAGVVVSEIALGRGARPALRLASAQPAPLQSEQSLGLRTFSGGELYLRQRPGKKDR